MNTKKVLPHQYIVKGNKNGARSGKACIKRKCRRALRRKMNHITMDGVDLRVVDVREDLARSPYWV